MTDDEAAFDAALERVGVNWERMYGELLVEAQRLTDEVARLRAENLVLFAKVPESTYDALQAENVRLREALTALTAARSALDDFHEMNDLADVGDVAEYTRRYVAFDKAVRNACAAAAVAAASDRERHE